MGNKVLILGGGISGLAASIYLASKGFDVELFEKNEKFGGKANELVSNSFRFDTGPSLITMPFVIDELFQSVNKNLSDFLKINRLEILCKYFFSDGSEFIAYSNKEKLLAEFENFSNVSQKKFEQYLSSTKRIYDLTADIFLINPIHELKILFNKKSFRTLLHLNELQLFKTMHEMNQSFFENKKLIQLFDRYATYVGSDPHQTPATFNIIQHVEYNLGGFTIDGGIYNLVRALEKLAVEVGVKLHKNSKVEKIFVNNKRVKGILVNGNEIESNIVLSAMDVLYTYSLMDKVNSREYNRYKKLELSSSALVFYWGVKINSESLTMHNIIFSNDYRKEFQQIFRDKVIPDDPTIYIYISSKHNMNDAPENHENWFVMINVPSKIELFREIEISNKIKENLIKKIANVVGIDISDKIVFEEILDPRKINFLTSSVEGALYGPASHSILSIFFRQRNKSSSISGLYFCGGTAHPGGGIALVILSAKIASELIAKSQK